MSRTTIKQVASLAGVSVTTVSQILNKRKEFPKETVDQVLKIVKETGYVADRNARQLRGPKRKQIGVIIPDLSNPFFGNLMSKLRDALILKNQTADLVFRATDREGLDKTISNLISWGVDGLIIADSNNNLSKIINNINIPFVLMDRAEIENDNHSVLVDDFLGGQIAANFLYQSGHQKVTIVAPKNKVGNLILRQKGFESYWQKKQLNSPEIIKVELSKRGGIKAAQLVDKTSTAIFALNDELGIGLIRGLYQQNRNVPNEISVVGYDGTSQGLYSIPSLTTIEQPIDQMCEQAITILLNQFNSQKQLQKYDILKPHLIERESTLKK